MKHLAVDFFHKLLLFIAVVAIIVASLLSVVRGLLPWLPAHRQLLENVMSHALQQPVKIDRMSIGWTQMEPLLQLQEVSIGDPHGALIHLPEIDVQLDLLRSLWQRQVQFSNILFKNARLSFYQDAQSQWRLAGSEGFIDFSSQANSTTTKNLMACLLSIKHLQLSQSHLSIKAINTPILDIEKLSIDFKNHDNSHQLFFRATLAGAPLHGAILMHGSAASFPKLDTQLYVAVASFNPQPWLATHAWHGIHWQQGVIDAQGWAHWQGQHWQQAQFDMRGQHCWLIQKPTKGGDYVLKAQHIALLGVWQPLVPDQQWHWQIEGTDGQLSVGSLFRTLMPFTHLQATANLSQDPVLRVPNFSFETPDAKLNAALSLVWPIAHHAPTIDLRASVALNNLNHTALYLPTGIMPEQVVHWLDQSVQGGRSGQVSMLLRGPLDHFPFADHSGLMDIRGQLQGVNLRYKPDWPLLTDLDATVQFTAQGFHIHSDHAMSLGMPLLHLDAVLPHYAHPALLHIQASTQGDLAHGIDFINQSPLKAPLAGLANSTASGPFALNLILNIPLSGESGTEWQGDVSLNQAQLSWQEHPLQLDRLQGKILFANDRVSSQGLSARLWGSTLHVALQQVAQHLEITGQGQLDTQQLPSAWHYAFWHGKAPYQIKLALAEHDSNEANELWFSSSLQGLSLALPNGLSKTAISQAPLQLHGFLNDAGVLTRVETQVALATQPLHGSYTADAKGGRWQWTAPAFDIALLIPAKTNTPWQVDIQRLLWQAAPPSTEPTPALVIDPSHFPAADIRAHQIVFGSQTLNQVNLQLRPTSLGATIHNFQARSDLYQLSGNGMWSKDQSQFSGSLETSQLQQILQSLQLPTFISADKSKLQFELQWPGAPWQMTLLGISGHLSTTLSHGSLPEVGKDHTTSMGFGKILNLLSLNSLPQHLSLDFGDVTDKGFSFDSLEGVFDLWHGELRVLKLKLQGGLADVHSHGCIDLNQQSYQLVLQIAPHLTSSLPVLATLAGGPIIGAVGLATNLLVSPALSHITSSTYLLTGPWADPQNVKYASDHLATAHLSCR